MRKKICFTMDTDKEQDKRVLAIMDKIPQCMRGSFIKIAILMDMDTTEDKDILQAYPNFLNDPMRYRFIKNLLRQAGQQSSAALTPHLQKQSGKHETLVPETKSVYTFEPPNEM